MRYNGTETMVHERKRVKKRGMREKERKRDGKEIDGERGREKERENTTMEIITMCLQSMCVNAYVH